MFKYFEKYKDQGSFEFLQSDNLNSVCNIPKGINSGLYIIFANEVTLDNLIYIGISGREGRSREIIHRKDGLRGRIVKGKQFGEARRKSWPLKMKEDGIDKIIVNWYVTHGHHNYDIPRPLEEKLLALLHLKNNKLPLWNKEI